MLGWESRMAEHCGCLHEMETWRALQPVESCRMGREGRVGKEGRERRERRKGRERREGRVGNEGRERRERMWRVCVWEEVSVGRG